MSWPTIALGEAVTFKGGGTPSRDNASFWGGRIPWATVKDFSSGYSLRSTQEFITEEGLRGSASNLIPAGTVVIPTRMALGKAAIAEADIAINQDLKAVLPTRDLDSRFLLWYFITNSSRIEAMGKGATVKGVTLDQLRSLELPMPSLAEQRRIAAILDKADAMRAKRREALAKLDQLLQSVFLDVFGDPAANPRGWRKLPLDQLVVVDAPLVDPREREYEDLLHFGPDRIEKETGRLLHARTAKEDGLISKKFLCDSRHILYSKIRPYLNKVALVEERCLCSADVYPVEPKKGLTRRFLWHILRSKDFLDHAASFSNRANIPKLNREQFLQYPCVVPPFEVQERFDRMSIKFDALRIASESSARQLESLFSGLQQRAFSGKV